MGNALEIIELLEQRLSQIEPKLNVPDGLFRDGTAQSIASFFIGASETLQQAMSRLTFFINRAGKNLDPDIKSKVEQAMDIVRAASKFK